MKVRYYDETLYLRGEEESLKKIAEEHLKHIIRQKEEAEYYHEAIEQYDHLIKQIATFLKELNCRSSLELSIMISNLINKGYLSERGTFQPIETIQNELSNRLGISIFFGQGCCRNISSFYYDIMKELGYPVKKFYCRQGGFLFQKPIHKPANHMINLIDYKDVTYGIDLYNGERLYHFQSPLKLSEISSTSAKEITYKPYYDMILEDKSIEEIEEMLEGYEKESQKRWILPLTYEDDIKAEAKIACNKEKELFEEISHQTKQYRKEIVHSLE